MAVPEEHQVYLRQSGFVPDCPAAFSAEERTTLARYGRWMEALAAGLIAPATPEQQHFVQVVRGEAVPTTWFEQIRVKVRPGRRSDARVGALTRGRERDRANGSQTGHDQLQDKLNQLGEARRRLEAVRELIESKRKEVLKSVEADLAEIEALYSGRFEEAQQIVAEIEAEVKSEVLKVGHSVRAAGIQAIYYRPRVTWDSKALARYAETNPEVRQFRKVGEASVSLRYR